MRSVKGDFWVDGSSFRKIGKGTSFKPTKSYRCPVLLDNSHRFKPRTDSQRVTVTKPFTDSLQWVRWLLSQKIPVTDLLLGTFDKAEERKRYKG